MAQPSTSPNTTTVTETPDATAKDHPTDAAPSTGSSSTLPVVVLSPTAMPLISPHTLLYSSLAQDPPIRCSGRAPSQCRPISINTSSLTHANGSTLIKLGRTAAVCGVRAEILPIDQMADFPTRRKGLAQVGGGEEMEGGAEEEEGGSESDEMEDDAIIRAHNLLVPNIELSTGCSPLHLPGSPPSQEAQSLSQRLLSLLHTSRLVRLSDLCIYSEDEVETLNEKEVRQQDRQRDRSSKRRLKAFYTLYIDTIILTHDGNVFDACFLALYSALRDTLLPKAWWDTDSGSVLCSPERHQARKLKLRGCPVPLSFVGFRSSGFEQRAAAAATGGGGGNVDDRVVERVLCDPDAFEEACCEERGCVTVDLDERGLDERQSGEVRRPAGGDGVVVIKLEKCGGTRLGRYELKDLVQMAADRWKVWRQTLLEETAGKEKNDKL